MAALQNPLPQAGREIDQASSVAAEAHSAAEGTIAPPALDEQGSLLRALGSERQAPSDVDVSDAALLPAEELALAAVSGIQEVAQGLRDEISERTGIDLKKYPVIIDTNVDRRASRSTPMEIVFEESVRLGYEPRAEIRIFPERAAELRDALSTLIVSGHELGHALDEQLGFPSRTMRNQLGPIFRGLERVVATECPQIKQEDGSWLTLESLSTEAWTDGLGLKIAIGLRPQAIGTDIEGLRAAAGELGDLMCGTNEGTLASAGQMARAAAFIKGCAETALGLGSEVVASELVTTRGEITEKLTSMLGAERAGQLLEIMDYAFRTGQAQRLEQI